MTQWQLNPVINLYGLLILVAVVGAASLVPTFKPMLRWQRGTLIGLRVAVVFLALVLMLRPTRISTVSRPVSALLVILFDQSRSMTVPDMPDGRERWAAQRDLLEEASTIAAEMPENLEVQFYGFDADAEAMELTEGALVLPTVPEGETTDYGSSLDDVLRKERGKRLAAVFLTGDGAQRAYAPRVEMQQAAQEVERLGAPLYAVALGKDIEQSQARDVAVENLRDHYTVFVKNELAIRASLKIRGFLNTPIAAQLIIEDAAGKQTVLGPVEKMISEEGGAVPLEFTFTPQQTGQYRLTLRAAEQAGELVTKNNQMTAFLTVRDGGLKVLYLEGELRHEYTFLRRAIGRAEDIQLEDVWIDHSRRDRWPLDFTERFRDPKYDVVVLGSVAAEALTPASIEALAEAVEIRTPQRNVGKGLLLLGGRYSYGPGRWAETAVGDLLPVILDRREVQDFDAPLREDRHWMKRLKMLPAQRHYVTSLAGSRDENDALWQSLEPLKGANRFDRLHPQAMVLAESEADVPLLLGRSYGDGRVLAFAGDSTYQWAMHGNVDAHRRLWRQCILWLAGKDEEEKDTIWIELDQRRFNPGGRVEFTTGIRRGGSSDGGQSANLGLQAEIILPDGARKPARLSPEGDRFLGLYKETDRPGTYTIEVTTEGDDPLSARTRFVVLDEDLELGNPSANPDALAAMAEVTQQFGGGRVSSEEMLKLLREIKNSPPELQEEVQQRFELGRTAGTAWLFFFAIVGLLTGEWYLRKKWGLV